MIKTVDALIILGGTHVLLMYRSKPPFLDMPVMCGGHVEESDESLLSAMVREVHEELGLTLDSEKFEKFCELDTKGRDPRTSDSHSAVFLYEGPLSLYEDCKPNDEVRELVLLPLDSKCVHTLGFDHAKAIELYLSRKKSM